MRLAAFLGVRCVPSKPSGTDFNRGLDFSYGIDRDVIELAANPAAKAGRVKRIREGARRWLAGPRDSHANNGVPSKAALRRQFADLLCPIYAVSNFRLKSLIDADIDALG